MTSNKMIPALAGFTVLLISSAGYPATALEMPSSFVHQGSHSVANESPAQMSATPSGHPAAAAVRNDKTLLAAAEPFENLTEMVASAPWAKIDKTIHQAERAASGARQALPQSAAVKVDQHLAALRSARAQQNRTDLAISSIEVYRVLVSSVSDNARIPRQVSLLDYSGFRYNTDLKASPIRWDDMVQVMDFAHQQWAVISPRLKEVPVAKRFEKSLDGMDRAVHDKNVSLAASSERSESDLVDELENYFRKH